LLKPMNCPMHIKIYASSQHSYRDLPVRLAEFGTVYRWEQSGELGGMTRVRGITQDDAHIFCTEEQVLGEIQGCLQLVLRILNTLGMNSYRVRVGLRDSDSSKYVGTSCAVAFVTDTSGGGGATGPAARALPRLHETQTISSGSRAKTALRDTEALFTRAIPSGLDF